MHARGCRAGSDRSRVIGEGVPVWVNGPDELEQVPQLSKCPFPIEVDAQDFSCGRQYLSERSPGIHGEVLLISVSAACASIRFFRTASRRVLRCGPTLTQSRLLGTELVMMLDRDLFDFLEHTTDAAFAVTDGGEICSWNAGAEALFGFGYNEALGRTCFELFQGRDMLGTLTCTEHCHVRDCAAHHTPIPDFDLEVNTRAGARIWVNMSTLVHEDPKSGRRRIVHLARSVEDRKRTEVAVKRMLLVSKQLEEVSDSFRPAPREPPVRAGASGAPQFVGGKEPGRHRARARNQPADAAQPPPSRQSEARHAQSPRGGHARDAPEAYLNRTTASP